MTHTAPATPCVILCTLNAKYVRATLGLPLQTRPSPFDALLQFAAWLWARTAAPRS